MQRDKEHRDRKVDLEARSVARTYDIHKLTSQLVRIARAIRPGTNILQVFAFSEPAL